MTGACRALLVVPLALAVDEYGLLVNFYPAKREFSAEEVELARMLGDQVILAVGNALLRQQAEETAIAQERGRIAGDLHDSVTQLLFSANLTAEALPSLLDGDLGGAKRSLDQLRSLTTRALAEMRALLLELRPSVIEESGLEQVLRSLVVAGSGRGGIPIRLTVHGALDLPHEVRVALYRIVQESLNNVIRHAHAHSAEVVITCKGHGVDVTVTDDGLGLDPNDVPAGHMGLRIMHERARAIGARLTVGCPPGGGTQVRVDWPASPKGGHS
jgi:signal transduction histidine kinase